jgi:hypothetical protein
MRSCPSIASSTAILCVIHIVLHRVFHKSVKFHANNPIKSWTFQALRLFPSTLLRRGVVFCFGMFYCNFFFLKISSYIKSPPPPPPTPNRHKNHSLRKAKSVEKWGGWGVHVTCSKLKLIKYVSTEEKDDIWRNLICEISFKQL